MSESISVKLPDGSSREIAAGSSAADLASAIGRRLAGAAVVAEVNGEERDLDQVLDDGDSVAIVTSDSEAGLYVIRHSTAHVLAQAVLDLYPGATFGIGPPVQDGFYYDFELPGGATFSDDDLAAIEDRMRAILAEDQPFVRSEIGADLAREVFADHPYKLEIIDDASTDPMSATSAAGEVRCYENPPPQPRPNQTFHGHDGFIDLCRGPHVPTTSSHLGHFKLLRVAGAYWKGDERNPQLQRIYGTAWASAKDLEAHLERLEQAARRDHRRLGTELDLFSFPSELGGGLAVWHPKGGVVRRVMEDYSRRRHEEGGYEFVYTPNLTRSGVFETSGHLDWYADGMYPPMEMDNGEYYVKPMNCPIHCLVYRSRQRSYRELPLRLFELGTVYRYERAGTLHGLMRIRGFTQDDSHIFVAPEHMAEEIAGLLDFVLSVLRAFGFDDFTFNLSTKDPDKFVGSDEMWEVATAALQEALDAHGLEYGIKEGDAAFYGPKIDIDVRDAIGRSWQLSTIQADFNHPERFGLTYVGADNEHHRPIMLHRALFGSIERFFGVLIEHYAGAFPTWLAPVQVVVCPVADEHDGYARRVADELSGEGLRVELSPADEGLGARIRKHKLDKIPHVLVVGGEDVEHGTVADNARGGEGPERGIPLRTLVDRVLAEVRDHT
jgi:threonyl-tRNA synthetase